MPINKTTTEKEFALMAFEAHWFGDILRMANARLMSGFSHEAVLVNALTEWRMTLNTREQISHDWEIIDQLVRDNAETDYLGWSKSRRTDGEWNARLEADAREQFARFRLARSR